MCVDTSIGFFYKPTVRTKITANVWVDDQTGSYLHRPVINGRRTWRRIKAATPEEAEELIRPKTKAVATVDELVQAYVAAGCPTLRGRQYARPEVMRAFLSRCCRHFGARAPGSLTVADCVAYGKTRMPSARAADAELQALSGALNWAAMHGMIAANPIRCRYRVQGTSDVRHSRDTMPADADELHRIARVLLEHPLSQATGWLMILKAFTGMRTGEALALRMDARSKADPGWIEGDYLYVRRAKSGQFPYVPLHPALRTALEWHRVWHAAEAGGSPWWFPGRDMVRPLRLTALTSRLADVCKRLGLPHRTAHGLRAYYVTVWRSQGKTDAEVAALIGDRTVSLIQTTYGSLPEVWAGGKPLDFMPENTPPAWKPIT